MITKEKILDRMNAYRDRIEAVKERIKRYPEILQVGDIKYRLAYGDTFISIQEKDKLAMYISSILDEFASARVDNCESLIAFKNAIEQNEEHIKKIHNILDEYDLYKSRILAELEDFLD